MLQLVGVFLYNMCGFIFPLNTFTVGGQVYVMLDYLL